MKEKLYTIPVNEGFLSGDECPFCFMEREEEQRAIRYAVGSGASYMEPEVRGATDRTGFCRCHSKKIYDYGNTLGTALILQTHFAGILEEFEAEAAHFEVPPKKSLFGRKPPVQEGYRHRLARQVDACFVCDKIEYNMRLCFQTFFVMIRDEEFRARVTAGKGFCLRHFARLLDMAESELPNSQREWFYREVFALMKDNLIRVKEDLDWLIAKYDYRNAGADWKNSRDALQRAMQKLEGLHPADPPYRMR